jgi:hypothetical protein
MVMTNQTPNPARETERGPSASTSKQHDADHAKNAFAVSGTSPTHGTSQNAPATPTPDTTPPKLCARLGCQNPITGNHRHYCSKACSAATRNRRYYLTLQGRLNKRAGASRYFQNHREELYATRRTRMWGYVVREMEQIEARAAEIRNETAPGCPVSPQAFADMLITTAESKARLKAALQHDYHPSRFGMWVGRDVWCFAEDGKPFKKNTKDMKMPFHELMEWNREVIEEASYGND